MPKRRSSHRPEQVAETVRQVIAELLLTEVRDPRIGAATVTAVEVTRDLAHAKIRVVLPAETAEDREAGLAGLRSAAGFLRSRVAKALATRVVPELHFDADRGEEHRARIEQVLAEIRREEEP